MARIKLKDIAEICQLDISTISRGLRNDRGVAQATCEHIQRLALSLGYRPHLLARHLAGGQTRTLWMILSSVEASIDHRLVRHATRRANQRGYTLFVALHSSDQPEVPDRPSPEAPDTRYQRVLGMAAQGTSDGALIIARRGSDDTPLLRELISQEIPLTFLDNYPENPPCPVVTTDNTGAAHALTERCAQAGATGALLLFDEHNPVARARLAGAGAACADRQLPALTLADLLAAPDAAFDRLGSRPAFIGSSQTHHVLAWATHFATRLARRRLICGVFDQWTGDLAPAAQVFVALQDEEALARHAVDQLIDQIENRPSSAARLIQIPLLGVSPPPGGLDGNRTTDIISDACFSV